MDEIPETIKFCEAAELLGVSTSTISNMVKSGEIPEAAIVRYGEGRLRRIIKGELIKAFRGWQESIPSIPSIESNPSTTSETP